MLHFFRRLRQKQLFSDQFRKYLVYALGEIALVVIGILIALQINNWNEDRKQRMEEIRILENMASDLSQDIQQLELNIQEATLRQTKADSILTLLYLDDNPDQNTFIQLNIEAIAFEDYFAVNSGTFDESQSAGSMKFIRNEELRQMVFNYYRAAKISYTDGNTVKTIYEQVFPTMFRKLIPTRNGMNLWRQMDTDLPEVDIKKLAKDDEYIAMFTSKVASEFYQLNSWNTFVKQAKDLKEGIQEELDGLE